MNETTSNTQCIYLDHVSSMEYYQKHEENQPIQVLKDISLEIHKGEIWSMIGDSAFELRLLLEIIANARPYQNGTCILDQRGMMRKKRVILPHLFYIGSTNMLFDNMTVLEYLMFITAKDTQDVVERQKRILQDLLDHQLAFLALSPIHECSPDERAVITLMSSLYTESTIIILNLARLSYQPQCISAFQAICETIRKKERTLLFSSFDTTLVERASTHIAVLKHGHIIYQGLTQLFQNTWDYLSIVIEDERMNQIKELLEAEFPQLTMRLFDHRLELWDEAHDPLLYDRLFQLLCEHQLYPDLIQQHHKQVKHAWEEIKLHDL